MFTVAPYQANITHWAYWSNVFTTEQLNVLEAEAALADEQSQTGSGDEGGKVNLSLRRSKVRWISPHDTKYLWLFQRLAHVVSDLNARFFRFDLTGFGEAIQLTRYEAKDKGEYGWHSDYGAVISRKLSLAVQLTDPSKYKGGDFELLLGEGDIQKPERQRGMLCAFPSYQAHRVTPVTKGVRHSLVVWVSGPPFR